jgi:hypothetical protein
MIGIARTDKYSMFSRKLFHFSTLVFTVSHKDAKAKQPRHEAKGNDRPRHFEGTLFFLSLSEPPIVIKNIERILIGRGAQISQFLHNGVTYILTPNNDANVGAKLNFKADIVFPQCTRSAQMLMQCRELHKAEDYTIDSLKIAKRLGIKIVTISDIFSQSDLQLIRPVPHPNINGTPVQQPLSNYKIRLVRHWLLQI